MYKERTPHILSTSSALLGFCLVVITSLNVTDKLDTSVIDEATALTSVALMAACILSFLSMRIARTEGSERMGAAAEAVFLGALVLVFIIIVLIALDFIR